MMQLVLGLSVSLLNLTSITEKRKPKKNNNNAAARTADEKIM
jgi:hypothetical protein